MKLFIFISILLSIFISCGTNNQKTIDKNTTRDFIEHIDKNAVSKIDLLIVDTSIIDLPSKQLTKLIDIGDGQSFVDSSGNPFCKPSQIITFKNSSKDSLIDIFNSYLDSGQQKLEPTMCIILYNHVFILYDNRNRITEQIDFAFNCPMRFDYLHRGVVVKPKNESSKLLATFVNKLKSVGAFIPVYGPPPPPPLSPPPPRK
jgi:hypothetical protein